ncbi:ABC transporter ATP-binding protein [Desulfosporosinus orientis]|nr:ABC transporter ATP-binding protein [Desulfosporosinus orientis]
MENVTKSFGKVVANKNINLSIEKGEVHTLLGENGAGKSTLMNVLIGLYQPTEGDIFINDVKVKIDSPAKAVKLGIGMVHQHFMLVEDMTVFENIILGITKDSSVFIKAEAIKKEILELSESYGLNIDMDKRIEDISIGEQQRVEILKVLYRGAELLILDEPTAVLTDEEAESLFDIIKRLVAENKTVIFISHKMREIMKISDHITVLRSGEVVTTVKKEETDPDILASLMVGHEFVPSKFDKPVAQGEVMISLDHICYHKEMKHSGLNNLSLEIKRGEVLGIAGVDGNGQSQLAQLVTGLIEPDEGEVILKAKKISNFGSLEFITSGVSHVPEDRNKMGLVGDMSISENLVLKSIESEQFSYFRGLKLKKKNIDAYAKNLVEKYDIRCSSPEQAVKNLSGGNQQKVIIARELEAKPDLLIAVHPTRGLDIGATNFVHECIISARDSGCAVLLISADLDEVLKLSTQISVMYEGRLMGSYPGDNPPIKQISLAMAGKQILN